MDLTSAAVLLWISSAIFFTIITLGSLVLVSSAFFKCKSRTKRTTHQTIDLEELTTIETSAGKTVSPLTDV